GVERQARRVGDLEAKVRQRGVARAVEVACARDHALGDVDADDLGLRVGLREHEAARARPAAKVEHAAYGGPGVEVAKGAADLAVPDRVVGDELVGARVEVEKPAVVHEIVVRRGALRRSEPGAGPAGGAWTSG